MNALLRGLEHPLAEAVGWALLHFLWQGLAVGLLLALSLAVLRRRSAQARYVVCCAAFATLGLFPVATTIWCRVTASPPTSAADRLSAATTSSDSQIRPGSLPGEAGEDPDQSVTVGNPSGMIPDDVATAALLPVAIPSPTWHDRVRTAIPWCVAAWLCGVLILSVRLLAIWSRVQRLRRVGVAPVSNDFLARFESIVARLRISRPVKLLQSTLVEVPTVIGWLRPVILLPIASLAGLTPLQLEAILIHELAHIRRWDYLVNLLQNIAETLLFYHPAVWWVSARIRQERENCCDDLAAAMCGDRVGYAEALVRMEELRAPWGHVAVAARGGNLLDRVRRLLVATERDRLPPWWQSPVAALVVVAGLVAGFWSVTQVTADTQQAVKAAKRIDSQEGAQAPRPQNVIRGIVRGADGRPVDKADARLINESPTVSAAEVSGGPPGQQTLADLVLEREPGQAVDIHPATARLFIAKSDGSEAKPLDILPEYVYHGSPRWSPDGKRIVFNVWKHGENHTAGQIAVVSTDGSNPRVLIDGLLPSFSPQGDRIAFSRLGPNSGVWVMGAEGPDTDLKQIDANGWGTDWSPDGKLVYSTTTATGANLVVFDPADDSRRLLFDEQKSPYKNLFWNMAWSPDGRRIVFKGLSTADKYEVGLVDARGAKQGLVHRLDGEVLATFAWSPDGSRVLFCKSCPEREHRSQIYTFDPDTNDPPQLLARQDPQRHCADVAWSPDGKQIAVSCFMQPAKKVQAVRASISPEILKARFVANFRGKRTDANALRLIRGSDDRYVSVTDGGLKMDLPAGEKKPEQAGISTEFLIRGDFELTAVFRSLKVHQPAAGWGAGLDLLLQLGTGPKDFILVERKLSGAGESVFATKHGHVDSAGKYEWQIAHHPPNEVAAGKIRVVRKGNVVYYLFAEYGTDDYQLFDERVISAEDVQLLKFVACANDRQAGSELLLEELEIRAAELPGLAKGQP